MTDGQVLLGFTAASRVVDDGYELVAAGPGGPNAVVLRGRTAPRGRDAVKIASRIMDRDARFVAVTPAQAEISSIRDYLSRNGPAIRAILSSRGATRETIATVAIRTRPVGSDECSGRDWLRKRAGALTERSDRLARLTRSLADALMVVPQVRALRRADTDTGADFCCLHDPVAHQVVRETILPLLRAEDPLASVAGPFPPLSFTDLPPLLSRDANEQAI